MCETLKCTNSQQKLEVVCLSVSVSAVPFCKIQMERNKNNNRLEMQVASVCLEGGVCRCVSVCVI